MSGRILKQVGHTTGTKMLVFGSRFALVYLLAHNFTPEDFGAYSLMSTLNTFGVMVAGLNLYNYLYREAPGLPLDARVALFKTTFVFELGLSSVLVTIFLSSGALGPVLAKLKASNYADAFVVSLVLLVALVAATEVQHYLWAKTDIVHSNRMDVITQASWVPVLLVIWLFKSRVTVSAALLAQLLAVLAGIAFAFRRVERSDWWRARPDPKLVRAALAYSLPMIIPGLSFYVSKLADRFLLSYFRSLSEVGLYSFAYSFLNTLYSFSALAVLTTMLPYVVEAHNREERERRNFLLTYALKSSLLIFCTCATVLVVFSRPILAIMGRPEYAASSGVMPVLALCFLFIIAAYPGHYLLLLQKRTVLLMCIDLSGMAVALSMDFLLIPHYSYHGAAAASAVAFGAVALVKNVWSRAWRVIQFHEMVSWRREREIFRQYVRSRKASVQPEMVSE